MASKKYLLLMGAAFCLSMSMYSQVKIGTTYDSTQIPSKRMPQHNEFLQGTNNFPAKPRNQWEIGVKLGTTHVSGDVPSQFAFPSFGLHVRKAFGYVFSMRLEYMYGTAKGLNWNAAENYYKAEFIFNDQHVTAFYNKDGGELLGLSRHITSFDLPLNLQSELKKSYSEYWISDLIEVTKSNSTTYYITIEDADTQYVLKATGGETWSEYKKVKKA